MLQAIHGLIIGFYYQLLHYYSICQEKNHGICLLFPIYVYVCCAASVYC
jgi:hypothetical protein